MMEEHRRVDLRQAIYAPTIQGYRTKSVAVNADKAS